MRKSELEKWQEQHRKKLGYTILKSPLDLIKLLADGDREQEEREINPAQLQFIQSTAKYKAYMGPGGSGKSVAGCVDIIVRALFLPGSKWFIGRRDYNDLKDTTLRTFEKCLARLPQGTLLDRSKDPPMKVVLRPIEVGSIALAPSEITFLGINDEMGSYEFNGGFIDEVKECELRFVDYLKSRLRYKPTPDYDGSVNTIGMALNPCDRNHWFYQACTGENAQGERVIEPWITLFRPHPRENQRNLPDDYYSNMNSMTAEVRQSLRDGEWVDVFPGEPVVREFNRELHVKRVKYGGGTVWRFWDFGYRRPVCIWVQKTMQGHIEVLHAHMGFCQEVRQFAAEIKRMTTDITPGAKNFIDIGDPAVKQHKDTGSALAQFAEAGILIRSGYTPFDLSMRTLRERFQALISGTPAFIINPSADILISALKGGYAFKKDGATPNKDGYYDHSVDALRYGIYFLFGASGTMQDVDKLPTSFAPYESAR